jgi:hypothetical protein
MQKSTRNQLKKNDFSALTGKKNPFAFMVE